jgi:hypothetical protein
VAVRIRLKNNLREGNKMVPVVYWHVGELEVQKMFSILRSARKVMSLEEVRMNQNESVGTYSDCAFPTGWVQS